MYALVFILVIIIILVSCYRYNYIRKASNILYVTVKGHNYEWNKGLFDELLKRMYPDKNEIVVKKISNPDILIVSNFPTWEDTFLHVDSDVPYITWSGESHRAKGYDPKGAKYNLISTDPIYPNDIWFPYLLSISYHYNEKYETEDVKDISERDYLIAYISSNCVKEREEFFKILNDKYSHLGTHALGKCSNNMKRIEGDFCKLDQIYNNYIFGFAMENKVEKGYITEKILNVYRGGAIPVYYGDTKSVQKFFNPETYIDLKDFSTFEEAASHLVKLSKDKSRLKYMKRQNIFRDEKIMSDINYYLDQNNIKTHLK